MQCGEEMVEIVRSLDLRRPDIYLLKKSGQIDLAKAINGCSFLKVTEMRIQRKKGSFFPHIEGAS